MKGAAYQVALSFAGEDRPYVAEVAKVLSERGIRVFYDEYERVNLWGKDLYTHLSEIYRIRSEYTVVFVSQYYAKKLWTNHERRSAQARAFEESREYILPAVFDDTNIEGIPKTVGYIDLRVTRPSELATLIEEKLAAEGHKPTKQKRMSNADIRQRALELAVLIRRAMEEQRYKQNQLIYDDSYRNAQNEEDRSAAWNRRNAEMSRVSQQLMDTYAGKYKSEILLLKDEMLLRVIPQGRDKRIDFSYEQPTNPLGLEEIITDFEKLALSLDER
jgi:hypothetical protein